MAAAPSARRALIGRGSDAPSPHPFAWPGWLPLVRKGDSGTRSVPPAEGAETRQVQRTGERTRCGIRGRGSHQGVEWTGRNAAAASIGLFHGTRGSAERSTPTARSCSSRSSASFRAEGIHRADGPDRAPALMGDAGLCDSARSERPWSYRAIQRPSLEHPLGRTKPSKNPRCPLRTSGSSFARVEEHPPSFSGGLGLHERCSGTEAKSPQPGRASCSTSSRVRPEPLPCSRREPA